MTPALLAIDQGTTSSRAILFSPKGQVLATGQKELKLHYPHKGWVEQNPGDIWHDTLWACREVVKDADNIAGIGIANQRETTIIWDRKTGQPVYNAIVWQDRRTAAHCKKLKTKGYEKTIGAKTGLLLDHYFSATKIAWILDNVKGARKKAEAGELAFGTVDCWLLWNLTDGKVHATDATNASRTMLFNIVTGRWDRELLDIFGIPESLLPAVHDNVHAFGRTEKSLLGKSYMIGGMAGDQQAALIGQACFEKGMAKATYGTGCFALMNIGGKFRRSKNRLLTTIAYRLDGKTTYAVEGSIFNAGTAIQWLRDGLGVLENSAASEKLARSVKDSNGVYFVPPSRAWARRTGGPDAKALICGLTRDSTAAHVVRAALEAQGFQTLDLIAAMEKDGGAKIKLLRTDGGLTANEFMCQFLSDILNRTVEIPRVAETTAWGAACLAGLQAGVFDGPGDIAAIWKAHKRYTPHMKEKDRKILYTGWKDAVGMLL